jgi:histone deacetylase 6
MLKHECICHNSKNHIETPERLHAIWKRLDSRGLLDECEIIKGKMASIEDISICHSELYSSIYSADIEVRSKLKPEYLQEYFMSFCMAPCNGFALVSDQDNSWNEEYTPTACRVAIGSTYEIAELVALGKLKNGFALVRPPGSHAEYNKPLYDFIYVFNNYFNL